MSARSSANSLAAVSSVRFSPLTYHLSHPKAVVRQSGSGAVPYRLTMTYRIIVAGAGIAGLSAAVALHRLGHTVSVLEERADTSSGGGISIWPNALAALDRIGLGDDVRHAGGRIGAGAVRWRDGTWIRRPSPQRMVTALGEPLVVIRRSDLRDILTAALPPDAVTHGVAVRRVVDTATPVRVELSDGSVRAADAVIGADGTHSVVARHLNGPLSHRYAGYTAWRGVADFRLDPDLAGETLGVGVAVGHVPMGERHTYWFATERVDEGRRSPSGELAHVRAKLADWAEPVPAILAATPEHAVLRNDLYDRARARRWARGPVVIVGDAAHPMRPHLGQGGCQAIEDAAVLAGVLSTAPDPATAFERFASLRKSRTRALVRESRMIGTLVNVRPADLGAAAMRATTLIPEAMLTHHLAAVAARSAFRPVG